MKLKNIPSLVAISVLLAGMHFLAAFRYAEEFVAGLNVSRETSFTQQTTRQDSLQNSQTADFALALERWEKSAEGSKPAKRRIQALERSLATSRADTSGHRLLRIARAQETLANAKAEIYAEYAAIVPRPLAPVIVRTDLTPPSKYPQWSAFAAAGIVAALLVLTEFALISRAVTGIIFMLIAVVYGLALCMLHSEALFKYFGLPVYVGFAFSLVVTISGFINWKLIAQVEPSGMIAFLLNRMRDRAASHRRIKNELTQTAEAKTRLANLEKSLKRIIEHEKKISSFCGRLEVDGKALVRHKLQEIGLLPGPEKTLETPEFAPSRALALSPISERHEGLAVLSPAQENASQVIVGSFSPIAPPPEDSTTLPALPENATAGHLQAQTGDDRQDVAQYAGRLARIPAMEKYEVARETWSFEHTRPVANFSLEETQAASVRYTPKTRPKPSTRIWENEGLPFPPSGGNVSNVAENGQVDIFPPVPAPVRKKRRYKMANQVNPETMPRDDLDAAILWGIKQRGLGKVGVNVVIARIYGITEQAVANRITRIKKALR